MTLAIVAGNPSAPRSSDRDRVVRRLTFAHSEMRRRVALSEDAAELARFREVAEKIGAAINIVAVADWGLEP